MLRIRAAAIVPAAAFLAATAAACIWDRDTMKDETRQVPQVFDLISGQFEHHGVGYYEVRLAEAKRSLGSDSLDVEIRNDVGVALLKLGRFEESLAMFRQMEAEDGKRYETLSNMGVLFKKMGRFQEAADYTEKALAMNPEGHLGMRDMYLKMLRWRAARDASPGAVPTADFLGREYVARARESRKLSGEDFDRILAIIRSDKTFSDAYIVLGEDLHDRGHLNLAFWAWTRAIQLGHPAKDRLTALLGEVYAYWKMEAREKGVMAHADVAEAIAAVTAELVKAGEWQKTFESIEGEMAKANASVQFEEVSAELLKRGIARVTITEHGLRNTAQEEMSAQEAAAAEATGRRAKAVADSQARAEERKAKTVADKKARIAVADAKAKKSFWLLTGAGTTVMLLAVGSMVLLRR